MNNVINATLVVAISDRLKAELLEKISSDLGCKILDTLTDAQELIPRVTLLKPTFLLLDPDLSKLNFANFIKLVKQGQVPTKLIVLSSTSNPNYLKAFLSSNGAGFIQKNCGIDEFVLTIKSILSGNTLIVSSFNHVVEFSSKVLSLNRKIEGIETLTNREKDVWRLLTLAKTEKEIADELGIKHSTVKTHKINISDKLNIKNNKRLSSFAANMGEI
jgi:DNA-binding NarL/FixJ family response regulator